MSERKTLEAVFCLVLAGTIAVVLVSPGALAQTAQPAKSATDLVVGAYSGDEPAFKDEEGELTGPSSYVFHLLPDGRCFMDARNIRTGYSGREFGTYRIVSDGKEITLEARFFPGMDSSAVNSPATDYFSTFKFRFASQKVTARYLEDSNAPTFRLLRVTDK